jgi:hypothetical protein
MSASLEERRNQNRHKEEPLAASLVFGMAFAQSLVELCYRLPNPVAVTQSNGGGDFGQRDASLARMEWTRGNRTNAKRFNVEKGQFELGRRRRHVDAIDRQSVR